MLNIKQTLSNQRALIAFTILLIFSGFIHFYQLSQPSRVIFDEVHFGSYINAYCCTGERIFDIHPPHSKIIIATAANWLGYENGENFKTINNEISADSAYALRFIPALSGTLFAPIIFLLVLKLGASIYAAILAGLLICLDNALLVQTRIIALDGLLLLGIFTSLLFFLKAVQAISEDKNKLIIYLYSIGSGVFAGLALGSKFTGLIALILPILYLALFSLKLKSIACLRQYIFPLLLFFGALSLYYLIGWYLHFELLNKPGPGDIWGIFNGSFVDKLINIHTTMLSANANIKTAHPDMSLWWGWPWMHSPLFYWVNEDKLIYLIGNPVVWWTSAMAMILFMARILINCVTRMVNENEQGILLSFSQVFIFFAYLASFMPFVLISRPLFLYHYFTPLVFSVILLVLFIDKISLEKTNRLRKNYLLIALSIATIISFYFMMPITYGLENGREVSSFIFKIFPSWQ